MYVTRCEPSKHWTNNKSNTVHTIEEFSYYLHEIDAIEKKNLTVWQSITIGN